MDFNGYFLIFLGSRVDEGEARKGNNLVYAFNYLRMEVKWSNCYAIKIETRAFVYYTFSLGISHSFVSII